jgi:hypothetical protein
MRKHFHAPWIKAAVGVVAVTIIGAPLLATNQAHADSGKNVRQIIVPAAAGSPPPAGSFKVKIDMGSDGTVFGSVTGKRVLGDPRFSPPGAPCGSRWRVSTTNNTAFVLHTPTNGNVAASRIDFGQSGSSYLIPGQTAVYCVAFTQLNQIFDVLYDMSDPVARAADGAMLVSEAMGFPAGDTTALSTFVSSVANIPKVQRIGACLGSPNPFCGPQAINALMTNAQSRNALLSALFNYGKDLGKSVTLTWLQTHLRQKLVSVITTGWWVAKFIGQVTLSPAGYVAFETAPTLYESNTQAGAHSDHGGGYFAVIT